MTLTFGSAGLTTLKKLEESGGKLDRGSTDKTHVGVIPKDSLEQFSPAAQRKLTDSESLSKINRCAAGASHDSFSGKTTINKLDRQIIVEVPSRWAVKPNTETLSIIQKEINPDAELAIIKTTYQIKFFTSKQNSGNDRISAFFVKKSHFH